MRLLKSRAARTVSVISLLTLAAALGPTYAASGDDRCKPVTGHLEEMQVEGEGFQAQGRLTGGIQGMDNFTLLSLSEPIEGTSVSHFVGRSLIETRTGAIDTVVSGAFDTASGKFSDLLTIVGGTGEWEGATGQIHLFGLFDLQSGRGESDYRGEVCSAP
jgi:hypothetical protein